MKEESDSRAEEELLRADHLVFVTLKYTRTVDVLKNIIQRLINALDFSMTDLLKKKKIKNIPTLSLQRCQLLEKKYSKNKKLKELIKFYHLLRRLDKADYKAKEEYRKHVTLLTSEGDVSIEVIKNYYEQTKEYVAILEEL